ncbi:MAG: hypothetical protein IAE64_07385 [Flavobacteriales bacterium]|nr:hypothetical protein [Flavobacteriales bacterium]MBW7852794.1 hypothetical protein [Candidatus Kapabacteria bacterium]MCC6330968.1 hypothetical protein [Ignavibacteria bacterium]NOG67303.1 hypothetical protein [Chlorobiota bacterium]MCL4276481.1 hypothetical protein [Ignavibacteria bacterium]
MIRKSRYTDEQIVGIVRESHAHGLDATSKKYNVSLNTICIGHRKYGSMVPSQVSELKRMTQESALLKKLLTGRDLEIEVMKENASTKW